MSYRPLRRTFVTPSLCRSSILRRNPSCLQRHEFNVSLLLFSFSEAKIVPPGRIEVVSRTLISLIISYNVMLSVRIPPVTLRDYSNPARYANRNQYLETRFVHQRCTPTQSYTLTKLSELCFTLQSSEA